MIENDTFTLGGHTFSSRFILGSGKYNLDLIRAAVSDAGAQIITLAVRRANTKDSENILDYIPEGVGGPHHYFGEYCFKPYIGNRLRPLTTTDMQQAVTVNRRAEILMILTGVLLYLL